MDTRMNQLDNRRFFDNYYTPSIEHRFPQNYPFFHQNQFPFSSNFSLPPNQRYPQNTANQFPNAMHLYNGDRSFDQIRSQENMSTGSKDETQESPNSSDNANNVISSSNNNITNLNNNSNNNNNCISKSNSKDRKQGKPVPEEKKDESYWERRMKNNLSAKRSREIRRTKAKITEEEINRATAELNAMKHHLFKLKREELRLQQLLDGLGTFN